MKSTLEPHPTIGGNEGFERGLTVEHILLSVTIVSTKESAGQFDDSCANQLEKAMKEYHGVQRVRADVLYNHTKIVMHSNDCECGICKP
jgi:hypothetical protein